MLPVLLTHLPSPHTHAPVPGQAMLMAMDELERAMLDSRVNPACSSRIFLHMMPELGMMPQDVVTEWKKVMDTMISRHATRLLKLRVDEIEVKARISPEGTSEVSRTDKLTGIIV